MKKLLVLLFTIMFLVNAANTQFVQNCTLLGLENCQSCSPTYYMNTATCNQCSPGFGCKPSSQSAYQSGPYSSGYGGYSSGYTNMSQGGGSCDCIPCDADCQKCTVCMPYDFSCAAGGTKCQQCSPGFYPNFQGKCTNATSTPYIFTQEQINKIIAKHGK